MSSQSVAVVASMSAVSQEPSAARVVVPATVPKPSMSASTKHVIVSAPLQSWSTPSSATSGAPVKMVGSPGAQSVASGSPSPSASGIVLRTLMSSAATNPPKVPVPRSRMDRITDAVVPEAVNGTTASLHASPLLVGKSAVVPATVTRKSPLT